MKPPARPNAEETAAEPELPLLRETFERGDFAGLHDQLARLPDNERAAASTAAFVGATSVDPAHVAVLALCVLALIATTLKYIG